MFREILVPLDFTRKNKAALDTALGLAQQFQAAVTLLHVVYAPDRKTVGALRAFYGELEAKARRKLATQARPFHKLGLITREKVVTGDTLAAIVREITRGKADLLVLASHRVRAAPGLHDWGTVSYKLAVLSPCQVLLVK